MDPFDPTTYEVSEDEIEALAQEPEVTLDKAKIREYLSHGGLISILRSNLQGGRNQPRVWLRPDNVGNVTHTFDRGRGIVGGETVPFGVVHDDRVFTPKQDEVLSFLRSFGLSDDDIQDVLSSVGVAP